MVSDAMSCGQQPTASQHNDMFDAGDGFHLPKSVSVLSDMYKCDTESITSSITSKRRIDMLFNDSRSVFSDYHQRAKYQEQRKIKSLVEGCGEDRDDDEDGYYADQLAKNDVQVRIEKMFLEISSNGTGATSAIGYGKFAVQHLGSMPVRGKITSVSGLQEPLKRLFFKYRQSKCKNTSGCVRITDAGLQVEYCSDSYDSGERIEKMNSFSNIAIWASLKFSCKLQTAAAGYEFAFVPVVSNVEHKSLYRRLEDEMTVDNIVKADGTPIFAIVMRDNAAKQSATPHKQLVCYGFVCERCEDAVIMAATLYKMLMTKLGNDKAKGKTKSKRWSASDGSGRPSNSIGETRQSTIDETIESEGDNYARVEKPPPVPPPPRAPTPPTRPPRKARQQRKTAEESRAAGGGESVGDVLTKVAIPRSGSFLNTNRLGSRYHQDTKLPHVATSKITSASPLGFVEMFNELRTQEGLKSVDEILNTIIKTDGMSFNELKPIYKEFLLKLALVLSKDELYHRSKSIMKLQQKKHRSSRLKKVIITKVGLKNAFCKPLVKFKRKNSCSCSKSKTYNDCTSTDSFYLADSKPKPEAKLRSTKTSNVRHKTFRFRTNCSRPIGRITSASEDSDYPKIEQQCASKFSGSKNNNKLKEEAAVAALRPSSSGYFSFSECSYDTESCTCTSADKCYCSLSKPRRSDCKLKSADFTECNCDTMLCRKRNKCYCTKPRKLTLVEQLKRRGFAVSESSLSPDTTRKKSSVKDDTKLSKSLEYLEHSAAKKYKNRMELYDTGEKTASPPPPLFPCRHTYKYASPSYSSDSSRASPKRSSSSDNFAVDYSLFAKSDDKKSAAAIAAAAAFRASRRSAAAPRTQNVIYAELACPKASHRPSYAAAAVSPIVQPVRVETPSVLAVYPTHTAAVRACNCACSCNSRIYAGGESFSPYKPVFASSPFHRMNMENIFGYYP